MEKYENIEDVIDSIKKALRTANIYNVDVKEGAEDQIVLQKRTAGKCDYIITFWIEYLDSIEPEIDRVNIRLRKDYYYDTIIIEKNHIHMSCELTSIGIYT